MKLTSNTTDVKRLTETGEVTTPGGGSTTFGDGAAVAVVGSTAVGGEAGSGIGTDTQNLTAGTRTRMSVYRCRGWSGGSTRWRKQTRRSRRLTTRILHRLQDSQVSEKRLYQQRTRVLLMLARRMGLGSTCS